MKKKNLILGIVIFVVALILVGTFIIIKQNKNVLTDNTCIVQFESFGGTKIELQKIEKGLKVVKPAPPIKEGFSFVEWQLNGETYNFDDIVTENIYLKAKWEVNEDTIICTITFNSCGGSEIEKIEVSKGCVVNSPNIPIREGYIFKGWFLLEEKFDFGNVIEEDIILEAKWVKNTEKIKNAKNESIKNENVDSSNGNITTESNKIDKNANYDEIDNLVYDYYGIWYLEGYYDVYMKITKKEYWEGPAMETGC